MKKQILERYSRNADNEIVVDIAAGKVEYIYNDFDKYAPYVKKELDQDLVEYIIDSVSEIGTEQFVIQFGFTAPIDETLGSRVKTSVQNYFIYLKELEYRELARMIRSSMILFSLGGFILSVSVLINHKIAALGDIVAHVFAEGINVAAWVSLWNAIATFIINVPPHRRKIEMFGRIAKAKIIFQSEKEEEAIR